MSKEIWELQKVTRGGRGGRGAVRVQRPGGVKSARRWSRVVSR